MLSAIKFAVRIPRSVTSRSTEANFSMNHEELRRRLLALPGVTEEWVTYTLSFSDGGPAVPTSCVLVRRSDGWFTVFRGDERGGVSQATAEDGETVPMFATEAQACEWMWNEILGWREFEGRRANRDQ